MSREQVSTQAFVQHEGPVDAWALSRSDRSNTREVARSSARQSLDDAGEPLVLLADVLRLNKSPRALLIDASEVILHIGDVGLKILPDQIGIGLNVFF